MHSVPETLKKNNEGKKKLVKSNSKPIPGNFYSLNFPIREVYSTHLISRGFFFGLDFLKSSAPL